MPSGGQINDGISEFVECLQCLQREGAWFKVLLKDHRIASRTPLEFLPPQTRQEAPWLQIIVSESALNGVCLHLLTFLIVT